MLAGVVAALPAWVSLPTGAKAPVFTVRPLDAPPLPSDTLRGKVVVLNFWEPRCADCALEAPFLQRMHETYESKGVRILGIAELEQPESELRSFIKQFHTTYPVAVDAGKALGKQYLVTADPTTYIIDREGKIRYVHTGFVKGDEKLCEEALQAVLTGRKMAATP
jgi:peroxiredoxin